MRLADIRLREQPFLVILGSFLLLIGAGTIFFTLPLATRQGGLPISQALFMATSAVCVTGLSIVDVGRELTPAGQVVLLILIQLGGLGLMTFTSLAFLMAGQSLPFGHRSVLRETLGALGGREWRPVQLVRSVLWLTAVFEGVGAAIFYVLFRRTLPPWEALKKAVFHSVSAFCNAGFALQADSFEGWRTDMPVNIVLVVLIVSGGLGFLTLTELRHLFRRKLARLWGTGDSGAEGADGGGQVSLSLHSRMVLAMTAFLLAAGAFLFWVAFRNGGMAGGEGAGLLEAIFLSVTARTAGFNTVPTAGLGDATLVILMSLMFVGASPGSTGGGVKTTTFYVILAAVRSRFQGDDVTNLYKRTIPEDLIRRAGAILLFGISIIGFALFLLLAVEHSNAALAAAPRRFLAMVFETVSAFGTVGLSMGVTARFSSAGLLILTILMYIGRIGPLTVFLALREAPHRKPRHPEETVLIG
ncbi:MAG: hypothetical protein O2807_11305 [bacterium]|nr:hypothetical protein [bacterium]